MSNEQYIRIFDESSCLTPKQLKGYVSGNMVHEESHAVEVHLLSCPLCSDAVEALQAETQGGVDMLSGIDSSFLDQSDAYKNLEDTTTPVAKSKPIAKPNIKVSKKNTESLGGAKANTPVIRILTIAASLILLLFCGYWIWSNNNITTPNDAPIAQAVPEKEFIEQETTPVIASNSADSSLDEEVTAELSEEAPEQDVVAPIEAGKQVPTEPTASTRIAQVTQEEKKTTIKPVETRFAKDVQATPTRQLADEQLEVQPTREVDNIADASFDNKYERRLGNSYAPKEQTELAAAKAPQPNVSVSTGNESAAQLYQNKEYKAALKKYRQQMNATNVAERDAARIMVSKCHIALGQKGQAKAILNSLIRENSTKKGEAEKLIESIK